MAQVGDVTITLHDLSELNGLRDDQTRLNELIARALLLRETKKRRLSVPDPVVEGRIAEIITSQFGGNRAAFEASLTARGETLDHYRQSEREKVEILSARQLILREVGVTARPRPEQEAALRQWLAARREETAVTFPSLPR